MDLISVSFEFLVKEIPFRSRMIVEAFGLHEYLMALRNGFSNVALTVWSLQGLQQVQQYNLPGVVLSASVIASDSAAQELAHQLHQTGCCIMVHQSVICDKPEFIQTHVGKNISRLYTDTWSPSNLPDMP